MKSQPDNKLSAQKASGELSDNNHPNDDFQFDSDAASPSKKPKMLGILLILSAVIVGFLYYKKNNTEEAQEVLDQKISKNQSIAGINEVIFHDLDEVVVNLDNKGKDNNFLKIKITLEIRDPDHLDVVKKMTPKINDVMLVYLKTLKPSDLKGSIGLYRLREELMIRFNKIITPAQINDVLFKDFIMQ